MTPRTLGKRIRPPALRLLLLTGLLAACTQPAPPDAAPPDTPPGSSPPPVPAPEQPDAGWTPLLGTDLSGWSAWPGQDDSVNDGVFRVEDGVLHVLGVPTDAPRGGEGYLASTATYRNYHLRFEYSWGEERFNDAERGGGLLYHVVGPDKRWPRSLEFQIQEGDVGDLWLIDRTSADTTVASVSAATPQYQAGGAPYTTEPRTYARLVKGETAEKPGWNQVELVVTGDGITHVVNGVVNIRITNPTQPGGGGKVPLTEGRIAFQAQNAEMMFRNIEIKELE